MSNPQSMYLFGEAVQNGFVVKDDYKITESTEGSEDKFFIRVNNKKYLVKDSSWNKRRKQSSLAPFCEYVGSNFIRFSGIPCQVTYLGVYENKPVIICEDLFEDCIFQPFKELHQSSADTDLSDKAYTYEDVLYVLKKRKHLENNDFERVKSQFWIMFLMDAILGNRDRHEGNWGFIKQNGKVKLSPIFDNGSSLFPDVDLSKSKDKDFIKERVFRMPASQFKMWKEGITDRPMRTNFYEIIRDYSDFFSKELSIVQKLDVSNLIENSIKDVPVEYANWFRVIIKCRFECLIKDRDFEDVWRENLWYTQPQ